MNTDIRGSDIFADCEVEVGKSTDGTPQVKTLPDFILSCEKAEDLAPVLGGCVFQLTNNSTCKATTFSSIESLDIQVKEHLEGLLGNEEWDGKPAAKDCSNVSRQTSVVRYKDPWSQEESEQWLSYYEFSARQALLEEAPSNAENLATLEFESFKDKQKIVESAHHHEVVKAAIQQYSEENSGNGTSDGSLSPEERISVPADNGAATSPKNDTELQIQKAQEWYTYLFCKAIDLGGADKDYETVYSRDHYSDEDAELRTHAAYERILRYMNALVSSEQPSPQERRDKSKVLAMTSGAGETLKSLGAEPLPEEPFRCYTDYVDSQVKQNLSPDTRELEKVKEYLKIHPPYRERLAAILRQPKSRDEQQEAPPTEGATP